MINLIPSVKKLEINSGFLTKNAIFFDDINCDARVISALKKLPYSKDGADIKININGTCGEAYEIFINENDMPLTYSSNGIKSAFTLDINPLNQAYPEIGDGER